MNNISQIKELKLELFDLEQQHRTLETDDTIDTLKRTKTSLAITNVWFYIQCVGIGFFLFIADFNMIGNDIQKLFMGLLLLGLMGIIIFTVKIRNIEERINDQEDTKMLLLDRINNLKKQLIVLD